MEQIASQIVIIHKGKKMVEGSTRDLLDLEKRIVQIKSKNDSMAESVIASSPFSEYLLTRKEGIFLKLPLDEIPNLNTLLVTNQVEVVGIETKNALEDYFLQVTSKS
jgi:ABC-type multidrug transport system ATPase subunit